MIPLILISLNIKKKLKKGNKKEISNFLNFIFIFYLMEFSNFSIISFVIIFLFCEFNSTLEWFDKVEIKLTLNSYFFFNFYFIHIN